MEAGTEKGLLRGGGGGVKNGRLGSTGQDTVNKNFGNGTTGIVKSNREASASLTRGGSGGKRGGEDEFATKAVWTGEKGKAWTTIRLGERSAGRVKEKERMLNAPRNGHRGGKGLGKRGIEPPKKRDIGRGKKRSELHAVRTVIRKKIREKKRERRHDGPGRGERRKKAIN